MTKTQSILKLDGQGVLEVISKLCFLSSTSLDFFIYLCCSGEIADDKVVLSSELKQEKPGLVSAVPQSSLGEPISHYLSAPTRLVV